MATAQAHGRVFVQFESANGSRSSTPIDTDSHVIGHTVIASATDRRQFYPLSYMHGGAALDENGFLWLKFKANAGVVIESEDSALYLDATLINKATGSRQPITITTAQMTGFTAAGTVDLTFVAAQTANVCYYQVPSGNQLVLGHPSGLGKAYCLFGDNA